MSIAEAVLGSEQKSRRSSAFVGLALALVLHAGLFLWALSLNPHVPKATTNDREHDTEVDLEPPVVIPAPEDTPEPPAPSEPPPRAARPPPKAPSPARASSPAQAGAVVAQEPDPNAPVDLSGDTFVTGTASAYAGGVTATSGKSTLAVTSVAAVAGPRSGTAFKTPPLSRPVTLAGDEWRCPWPHEAEREQIDEQTVTLRVLVAADGHAVSVTVLEDPGYGFGAAARACSALTRFTPALDAQARPTQALSPPIRVHFIR